MGPHLTEFLPTTKKEIELRNWDACDIVLLSGDAYVDHPSFGVAVIGRTLESLGLRVAVIPQPDWHGDFRDFKKFGRPRLFFAIAPGCMDSMVNKYTANRRLRSEDAYSPDGRHDMRPEYPTIVYSQILREIFPEVPIVIGGIEASMRRLTHYDYWKDELQPSILISSGADLLIYGMGELPITSLCKRLLFYLQEKGLSEISRTDFHKLQLEKQIPQTVLYYPNDSESYHASNEDILLYSHEECLAEKKKFAANFRHIEEESNRLSPKCLLQHAKGGILVVQPPFPPMSTQQIDASFRLPYTRLPHPKYKGKRIPAYEMIKFSVNIHRGCFGGCSFCTISAHQGKFIMSRSKENILEEVKRVTQMADFRGTISDLGGPSANMYQMGGKDRALCARCARPSCLHPKVCPNLDSSHAALLDIYNAVSQMPKVKHVYIGSGIRYDLLISAQESNDKYTRESAQLYTKQLISQHVSGRLKVAPEHTAPHVLDLMRKPSFLLFQKFQRQFERICREEGIQRQLIPYFISSHPGCKDEDMAELAIETKKLNFKLEQVQDFTPTPMTVSTVTWYSGYHPYTLRQVSSARKSEEKLRQRMFFFWYKAEERGRIERRLRQIGRSDLIEELYPQRGKKHF